MIAPEAVVVSSADFDVFVFGIVIDLKSKITLFLEDSDAFAALSDCIWALVLRIFYLTVLESRMKSRHSMMS